MSVGGRLGALLLGALGLSCAGASPAPVAPASDAATASPAGKSDAASAAAVRAPRSFEVYELDVETDLFCRFQYEEIGPPEGALIGVEQKRTPTGAPYDHCYVVIVQLPGMSLEGAPARRWAESVPVPAGRRLAWSSPYTSRTEAEQEPSLKQQGHLLRGEPIVEGGDVVAVTILPSPSLAPADEVIVQLQLTAAARARFAEATRRNLNRQLALVSYGEVLSAPMILSEISHGRLQVDAGPRGATHTQRILEQLEVPSDQ